MFRASAFLLPRIPGKKYPRAHGHKYEPRKQMQVAEQMGSWLSPKREIQGAMNQSGNHEYGNGVGNSRREGG